MAGVSKVGLTAIPGTVSGLATIPEQPAVKPTDGISV